MHVIHILIYNGIYTKSTWNRIDIEFALIIYLDMRKKLLQINYCMPLVDIENTVVDVYLIKVLSWTWFEADGSQLCDGLFNITKIISNATEICL